MNRLFNPALLVAIGVHALFLAIPLSGGSKSTEPTPDESPTEEENQTAELPSPDATALPSPQLKTPALKSPTVAARSPVSPASKRTAPASPRVRTSARSTRPTASRSQPASRTSSNTSRQRPPAKKTSTNTAPEAATTTTRDRTQETTPAFSDPATNAPSPSSTQPKQPQAVAPSSAEADPFAEFPQYPFGRSLIGSLRLLPPGKARRETYAFNTREAMAEAIKFYENEIPKDLFEPLKPEAEITDDLAIYEVKPKNGGQSKYLHLISFKGQVVILLLPDELSDLDGLKEQAAKQLEEQQHFFRVLSQMERIRQHFSAEQFIESQTAQE